MTIVQVERFDSSIHKLLFAKCLEDAFFSRLPNSMQHSNKMTHLLIGRKHFKVVAKVNFFFVLC